MAVVVMFGCSPSTQIVKSWQEPAATLQVSPENKVLTIAMVKDETSRRMIEDQLVKQMKGHGTASYTFLTPELLKEANSDKLTEKIKEGKYNYILLMRLGDVEKEGCFNVVFCQRLTIYRSTNAIAWVDQCCQRDHKPEEHLRPPATIHMERCSRH